MLNFQLFYRKNGVRLLNQIAQPEMKELIDLELPMNSIYHFCDYDKITDGPVNDDVLFKGNKKPIQVSHVTELKNNLGFPRVLPGVIATDIKDYHTKFKRTRWLRNIDSVSRDPQSLIVFNYSLLFKCYKYVKSFFSNYYEWYNVFSTTIDTFVEQSNSLTKNHFITVNIPKIIPSIQQLEIASKKGMNQAMLKIFRDKDSYILLELWKWLHEDKEIKTSSLFSKIPSNRLHLFNIVYLEGSKWTVLNLGILNSFNELSKDDKDIVYRSNQVLKPIQLQKRLLRMQMTIMEVRTLTAASDNKIDFELIEKQEIAEQEKLAKEVTNTETSNADVPESATELVILSSPHQDVVTDDSEVDQTLMNEQIKVEDDLLDQELAQLSEISKTNEGEDLVSADNVKDILNETEGNLEDGILNLCSKLADDGLLSAAEYKRFINLSTAYKNITAPNGKPMHEFIKINPDDLKIQSSPSVTDKKTVLDKTMLKSSLLDFDKKYIKEILPKDVFSMVLNVQKAGIAVTEYTVEPVKDILGEYETHIVKLQPVIGKQSTIRFKIPIIQEDGEYKSQNVKYFLRKQKSDLPIRKIDSNEVALTSYYGKTFVTRGRRKVDDYGHWLINSITASYLNDQDKTITDLTNGEVFDQFAKTPRSFSAISTQIKTLKCRGFDLYFDYKQKDNIYTQEEIKELEKHGSVILGKNSNNDLLVLDQNNTVYVYKDKTLTVFGSIEYFFNLDSLSAPVEYAEVGIFAKDISVGFVLAYFLGLEKLIKLLKVKPRRVLANTRVNLTSTEWALKFSDETLVFSREDRLASLILGGLDQYHKSIKMFSVYSFDKKGVYLNILESNGLTTRYLREMELMNKMFIDPITKDILVDMKEPTTFQGLLMRSCEMLLNDQHPDALDPKYMRIKGYERIAGSIYTELIQSLRYHDGRLSKSNTAIELNPYAVWKRISEDPSKAQVNEINPVEQLKELEAVTYAGTGGRSKRSMVKSTRSFHENDMGTISESTVDSSDVGINIFTSADPQFDSLRGTSRKYNVNKDGTTALVSTSALLAPGSDTDDPKRVNFVGIQNSHFVSCEGYHQNTTRTGYDSVVADRTFDLFAYTAKKPGFVKSIDSKGIIVEYEDKEIQGFQIGRRFGSSGGLTIPHEIVTPLKLNDKFKVGDAIVYNDGFFEPDFFDPKKIVLKNSMNVKTVLWESYQTLEDASSISRRLSDKLSTRITKVKDIIVSFDQSVSKLVKVGDITNADTVLCIIEDAITANNNLFNETSIDTLRLISAQAPKAHVKGIVEKIEVFYHGDKEDMSDSLKKLANENDKRLKEYAISTGSPVYTGSVDSGLRIDNDPLSLDNLCIRIYISSNVGAGVGD